LKIPRLSFLTLLILLLLPLAMLFYYAAVNDAGKVHGLTIGPGLPSCDVHEFELYMLASKGDKVSLDVSVSDTPWTYNVTYMDLLTGEKYSYIQTYYSVRAPTPVFIVPRTSLYYIKLYVSFPGKHNGTCTAQLTASIEQTIRYEVINRTPYYLLILILLAFITEYIIRRKHVKSSAKLTLFIWEFKYMGLWIFSLVTLYTYALFYLDYPSSINSISYIWVISHPIYFGKKPDYILIYLLILASMVTMTYTYSWEAKFDRITDLLPITRVKKFFVKLSSIIMASYFPLVFVSLMIYLMWVPDLVFTSMFIKVYLLELLHYLVILFCILSFTLPPAIIISRVNVSLVLSTIPFMLLYLNSHRIPREWYIFDLRLLTKNSQVDLLLITLFQRDLLKEWYMIQQLGYLIFYLIVFVIIVLVLLMIYRIKESP